MRSAHWRLVALAVGVVLLAGAPVAHAQCGPMDVVFVVDTTGSMGDVIANVKANIPEIIKQVQGASGGDYRLGLVEFGTKVIVDVDMAAHNDAAISAAVTKLTADGGGNEPEASDEAIHTVLDSLKASDRSGNQIGDFNATFRPGAVKIIILQTDARPAGFDDEFDSSDEANVQKLAKEAQSKGVHISAIYIPTEASTFEAPTIIRIMKEWATLSSGIYIQAKADGSGTAGAITSILADCGGATTGPVNAVMTIDPLQVTIGNTESADFNIAVFGVPDGAQPLDFSATGLPDDATVKFTRINNPDLGLGVQAAKMTVTAGPNSFPGPYQVVVRAANDVSETFGTVEVDIDCVPPIILHSLNQPNSGAVAPGSTTTLVVRPNGSGPFTYQWYLGHARNTLFPIDGGTSSSVRTPAINGPTDFWVRVSNACGSADSETATVTNP